MADPSTERRDDVLFTVTEFPQHGWQVRINDDDGTVEIVFGPALPPIGQGSARLFMPTSGPDDSVEIRLSTFDGTLLRDLNDLRYWTYATLNEGQWPYIILDVFNGVEQDFLIFEPTYQSGFNITLPDQGPPVLNTWQD